MERIFVARGDKSPARWNPAGEDLQSRHSAVTFRDSRLSWAQTVITPLR
jgi:hypothetical protein